MLLSLAAHAALLVTERPSLESSGAVDRAAVSVRLIDASKSRSDTTASLGVSRLDPAVSTATSAEVLSADSAAETPRRVVAATASLNVRPEAVSPSQPAVASATPPDTSGAGNVKAPGPPSLPPADAYAFSGGLDPGPQLLSDVELVYPEAGEGRSGTVVIRILIGESGLVDDVAVADAKPPNIFEESALSAFRAARFAPGKLLGVPVKSQMTIEVAFTPLNRGARVSGRGY